MYSQLPTVEGSCGDDCTWSRSFSCVEFGPTGYNFTDCTRESTECMGRLMVTNNCGTKECCQALNHDVLPEIKLIGTRYSLRTSFNYDMKFYNQFNQEIPCDEFSSNGVDRCIQFAEFGVPSMVSCNAAEIFYHHEYMAFELF